MILYVVNNHNILKIIHEIKTKSNQETLEIAKRYFFEKESIRAGYGPFKNAFWAGLGLGFYKLQGICSVDHNISFIKRKKRNYMKIKIERK